MGMSKRFQIPVTPESQRSYQQAAKKKGISAAEWARRILDREAKKATTETLGDVLDELHALYGPAEDLEAPERDLPREIEDWTK